MQELKIYVKDLQTELENIEIEIKQYKETGEVATALIAYLTGRKDDLAIRIGQIHTLLYRSLVSDMQKTPKNLEFLEEQ